MSTASCCSDADDCSIMSKCCCRYAENRHTVAWKWLWFFTLQGVVVGIEQLGKKVLKRNNLAVPTVIAVGVTVPLQMWLAHMLFFPPCTDADMTG